MILGRILVALICAHTALAAITDREEWDKRFYNFSGPPLLSGPIGGAPGPIAVYRPGEFLVAGSFTILGDTPLLNLARWDGTNWTRPFASDPTAASNAGEISIAFSGSNDAIHSLASLQVNQSSVEVLLGGAGITNAGGVEVSNVAWWTGSHWDNLGGGTTGLVSSVLFDATGAPIAGGNFSVIGGVTANNIARYTGTGWEPMGEGLPFAPTALVIYNGQLHAAGQSSSQTAVLRWTGTEWVSVGTALLSPGAPVITSLFATTNGLYVGGLFSSIEGVAARNIARVTGTKWQPLGSGLNIPVRSIAEYRGEILAVGTLFSGLSGIAHWNDTTWTFNTNTPLRAGKTIVVSGDRILARGQVNTGLDDVLNGAAYFNGATWKSLGQGVGPGVITVESNRRMLHFVSDEHGVSLGITHAPFRRGQVTRWNGEVWEKMGGTHHFPSRIDALDLQGDHYWVGTIATGWLIPGIASIARTGETTWTNAAAGFTVSDIVVAGAKVFAGGNIGGSGLYELNGSQFSKVAGYSNLVYSLATDGNTLYVAGRNSAGFSVSSFDGRTWTELATFTNVGQRFEIKFANGSLYVFGGFTSISGIPINRLGRWDGGQWHAVLPEDFALNIFDIAGDGRTSLYVGGFRSGSRTNLYQVRGSTVVPVAVDRAVEALHWWRGALYLAGDVLSVETVSSQSIAAWHDPEAVVEVILSAPISTASGTEAELTLHVANVRTNALSDVLLTMPLPPGATPVRLSPEMSVQGTNLLWQIPALASGLTNLTAHLRLRGAPGTNFTFEVWSSGPNFPTFRSSPAWTTLAPPPQLNLELLGRNSDGSWNLSWSGDSSTTWTIEKSHDLIAWETQSIEQREGQPANEFTIPASEQSHTFWRISPSSSTP